MSQLEVVYLEPSDNAAAVRQRLRNADGRLVLVVVPRVCPGLDSLVDLRLLGREAVSLDKKVALVTRDRRVKELARGLGFRTFSSVESGRRAKWGGGEVPAPALSPVSARYGPSVDRKPEPIGSEALRRGEKILLSFIFMIMAASLGLIMILVAPSATITMRPATYPVQADLTIQGDPDVESVDFIGLRLPAKVVQTEVVGSDRITTTAIRDEPHLRAGGEVVFTSKRSEATTVISGTVVSTSAGTTIRFRTMDEVALAPSIGGRGRVRVEAIEPGPTGNVPAYSINRVEGPMELQVNVINPAPMSEGAMTQVTYVTGADKEQLMESLLQRIRQEGYQRLTAELAEGEFLPEESLVAVVLSETYDKFPDEVADSLGLHMRVLVRGTVINRKDAELLGSRMLQFEVPDGFELLPEETEFQITDVSEASYDGTLTFDMSVQGTTWAEIDEADIKAAIKGKSASQARDYLTRQLSLVEEPSVEISTAWWRRVPWLPFRISIRVLSGEGAGD